MTNEIVEQVQGGALTAANIRAQVNLIQEVMKAVMQKDQHYGVVPGCGNKPTLLKPGAEKLLSTFRIAVDPIVEDLSTSDEARYRVTAKGISQVSGVFLGGGVGECSSSEEKYKWKKAVCDEEFEATPDDRKRVKWFAPYNKPKYCVNQVRTNHADVANTILKMAKKRAQIDMTLTVTAASDIFTQDLEDLDVPETPHMTKPVNNTDSEYRAMKSLYPGKCGACGQAIDKGDDIMYHSKSKKPYHPICVQKPSTLQDLAHPDDNVEFGEDSIDCGGDK